MIRHETIDALLDRTFDIKIGTLFVEDLLSNYCGQFGDEQPINAKVLNDIEKVCENMNENVEKLRSEVLTQIQQTETRV